VPRSEFTWCSGAPYARIMARPPRILVPGGFYHVTCRGNRRQPIYADDRDRELFLRLVGRVVARRAWRCHAFCLMPNHYHLVVETPKPDLSAGMHALNLGYARCFNLRHTFTGHLFERRFYAVLVQSDWHALELSRYVVLNPVRAGLAEAADTWPWSSYRSAVGETACPAFLTLSWLLGFFGRDVERARAGYRSFVQDAAPTGPR
jgi:REP-associated tyrosine transposase